MVGVSDFSMSYIGSNLGTTFDELDLDDVTAIEDITLDELDLKKILLGGLETVQKNIMGK
jgi:hypothetical protein